jgi:cytochrome c553
MKTPIFCFIMAFCSVGMAQAGDPVIGKQKSVTCIECHGYDGIPGKAGVPKIDRMPPETFTRAIRAMREAHYDLPITAHALSEQDGGYCRLLLLRKIS